MTTPEAPLPGLHLRRAIAAEIERDPVLVSEFGVELKLAPAEYTESVAALYRNAFERGDYFASRYSDPENQIFSPQWLEQEFQDPEHLRFIFTDSQGILLGATGFFHDRDSTARPLMTSDATQIDIPGRGEHIMGYFFGRIVPIVEACGDGILTDFVLTPESKGLRRTLQTELGMVALGIHPHALHHRKLDITRSEISAAKYPVLTPKPVRILPEFEPLYRIVQSQLPLPEPTILPVQTDKLPHFTEQSAEVVREVDAIDPESQRDALAAGWAPVEFDPDSNLFKVAQFPSERPELDFILTNEDVPANKLLVRYLNEVLYGQGPDKGGIYE
ncbi:MAG TPA: hypothetical protein VFP35_02010 [Candidatus Saccharimonadales bacterium]|nr:hypothetical protein [Candidatus Saccharimonadales bacterium]